MPDRQALADLLARQAQDLNALTAAFADVVALQGEILAALVAPLSAANDEERESANEPFADLANVRGSRKRFAKVRDQGRKAVQGFPEVEKTLPSFLNPRTVRETREQPICGSGDCGAEAGPELGQTEVEELVGPLREWCRANGRVDRLDEQGRRHLAMLSREELDAGVRAVRREAAADERIKRPLGLLVARARDRDPETFGPPATTRPTPVEVVGEGPGEARFPPEVEAAVAALETDATRRVELALLDAQVARMHEAAAMPARLRRQLTETPALLRLQRRLAYRAQHPTETERSA